MRYSRVISSLQGYSSGLRGGLRVIWRGDGAAERASLENWRPRKGSASSNLAPSANSTSWVMTVESFSIAFLKSTTE